MPVVDPVSSCSLGIGVGKGEGGEGAIPDGARPGGLEVNGGLFRPTAVRIVFRPGVDFIKLFSLSLTLCRNSLDRFSMASVMFWSKSGTLQSGASYGDSNNKYTPARTRKY